MGVGEGGQEFGQRLQGRGGELRQFQPFARRPVGEQVAGSTRRSHRRDPPALHVRVVPEVASRGKQLLEGVHPHHPELAERSIDHPVVAHEGTSVSEGGTGTLLGAAGFEGHDRFTGMQGPLRHVPEVLRVSDRLQERRDHLGVFVLDEIAHDVGRRDQRLVAGGNHEAEPHATDLGS